MAASGHGILPRTPQKRTDTWPLPDIQEGYRHTARQSVSYFIVRTDGALYREASSSRCFPPETRPRHDGALFSRRKRSDRDRPHGANVESADRAVESLQQELASRLGCDALLYGRLDLAVDQN